MTLTIRALSAAALVASPLLATTPSLAQGSDQDLARIDTVVVVYAENRSFDHLYGFFPGANGIAQATEEQKTQLDHDGKPLRQLTVFTNGKPDGRFPQMPNRPFAIEEAPIGMSAGKVLPSPIH